MKNLFETERAEELKLRVSSLTPANPRLWGKMDAAQALAHCVLALDMGIWRWEASMRRPGSSNLRPSHPALRLQGRCADPAQCGDLACECERLRAAIDRFAAAGPAGCTAHPHFIFGRLTPEQWAILMYKHVDHHLRQFSA